MDESENHPSPEFLAKLREVYARIDAKEASFGAAIAADNCARIDALNERLDRLEDLARQGAARPLRENEVADVTLAYTNFLEMSEQRTQMIEASRKEEERSQAAGEHEEARRARLETWHLCRAANEHCEAFQRLIEEPLRAQLKASGVLTRGMVIDFEERGGRWIAVMKTWQQAEADELSEMVERGLAIPIGTREQYDEE